MTDNIKINPFTNTALSAEEILQLDTNQDGVVSVDELYSNTAFISKYTTQDAEGEVEIEEANEPSIKNFAGGCWEFLKAPMHNIWGGIKGGAHFIAGIGLYSWNVIKGIGLGAWDMIKGIGNGAYSFLNGSFQGVTSLFGGIVKGWGQIFKGNILNGIGTIFKGIGNAI